MEEELNKIKRAYYEAMYHVTDSIMWQFPNDPQQWNRWWNISENYRAKRDAVG